MRRKRLWNRHLDITRDRNIGACFFKPAEIEIRIMKENRSKSMSNIQKSKSNLILKKEQKCSKSI